MRTDIFSVEVPVGRVVDAAVRNPEARLKLTAAGKLDTRRLCVEEKAQLLDTFEVEEYHRLEESRQHVASLARLRGILGDRLLREAVAAATTVVPVEADDIGADTIEALDAIEADTG